MNNQIIDNGPCAWSLQKNSYTAAGAYLDEQGGVVYVCGEKDALRVTDWHENTISNSVYITGEWTHHGKYGCVTMRAIRFRWNNTTYAGRYGCDWSQLCRVHRIKGG